jgi:hypothetical protein
MTILNTIHKLIEMKYFGFIFSLSYYGHTR